MLDAAVWELALSDNVPQFWVRTDQDQAFVVSAQAPLAAGTWHRLAGVLDQVSSVVSLYVDGTLAGSAAYMAGQTVSEAGAPLEVGRRFVQTYVSPPTYFSGALDEVAIFNTALTTAELAALDVPEPAGLVLLGTGVAGLALRRRRSSARLP